MNNEEAAIFLSVHLSHLEIREDILGEDKPSLKEALSLAILALQQPESVNEKLREACEALANPDGIICGPICDGPELAELNEALADARLARHRKREGL